MRSNIGPNPKSQIPNLEFLQGPLVQSPTRPMALNPELQTLDSVVQSPINRHPDTGMPVWFCNIHNHARYLRDRRPCTVPEVSTKP